jgi:hypothetical protein
LEGAPVPASLARRLSDTRVHALENSMSQTARYSALPSPTTDNEQLATDKSLLMGAGILSVGRPLTAPADADNGAMGWGGGCDSPRASRSPDPLGLSSASSGRPLLLAALKESGLAAPRLPPATQLRYDGHDPQHSRASQTCRWQRGLLDFGRPCGGILGIVLEREALSLPKAIAIVDIAEPETRLRSQIDGRFRGSRVLHTPELYVRSRNTPRIPTPPRPSHIVSIQSASRGTRHFSISAENVASPPEPASFRPDGWTIGCPIASTCVRQSCAGACKSSYRNDRWG